MALNARLEEGRLQLEACSPRLIVLDVRLPDGSGVELAALAAQRRPKPTVVAVSGMSSAAEAFELAQAGVSLYLPKPFDLADLRRAVREARDWVPPIDPFVKESVGKRELLDVVANVRSTMVDEALARSEGSRRGAAKQLGVSRQAIQQIVRKRPREEADRTGG